MKKLVSVSGARVVLPPPRVGRISAVGHTQRECCIYSFAEKNPYL